MLRRLLLQWFWDTYDSLGRLVLLNLMLFTVFLLLGTFVLYPGAQFAANAMAINPALGGILLLLLFTLGGGLVLTLWLPGMLYFGWQVSRDGEFALKDYFRGLRAAGGRFFLLSTAACFLLGVAGVNILFYARTDLFGENLRLAGAALAGLCFWVGLLILGLFANTLPVLARGDRDIKTALKLGLYVTLRYPIFTYGALLFLGILWLLSVVLLKTAPLWVIGLAATAMYLNSMHDVVVRWEEKKEKAAGKEAAEAARPKKKAASWIQIRQEQDEETEAPDRYLRTARDILKPWE